MITEHECFLFVPFFWLQGDMGPVGEMGLPGPIGLKVIRHTHTRVQMETVTFTVLS